MQSLLRAQATNCWADGRCPPHLVEVPPERMAQEQAASRTWYSNLQEREENFLGPCVHLWTEDFLYLNRSLWRPFLVTFVVGGELPSAEHRSLPPALSQGYSWRGSTLAKLTLGIRHMSDFLERRALLSQLIVSIRKREQLASHPLQQMSMSMTPTNNMSMSIC